MHLFGEEVESVMAAMLVFGNLLVIEERIREWSLQPEVRILWITKIMPVSISMYSSRCAYIYVPICIQVREHGVLRVPISLAFQDRVVYTLSTSCIQDSYLKRDKKLLT